MMFTFRAFLAAYFLLLGQVIAKAQDQPDEAQIQKWIEELANSLPARKHKFPEDDLPAEERKSLEPVRAAYRNLTKHFSIALPLLIEKLDDERYSFPQQHPSSGVFSNRTVGDACRSIINDKILLKSPSLVDDRLIVVWHRYPVSKEWYEAAKGKSLYELQVEALDWILEQPPPGRNSSEDEWKEKLDDVRQFREDLVRNGKAVDRVFGPTIQGK